MLGKIVIISDCYYILRTKKDLSVDKKEKGEKFNLLNSKNINNISSNSAIDSNSPTKTNFKKHSKLNKNAFTIIKNKGLNCKINGDSFDMANNNYNCKNSMITENFNDKYKRFEINSREATSKKKVL